MKKRLSLCSTASAKLRRQSLDLEPGAIGAHAWQAHVRAYVNVSDGEEKYYAKLAARCRRYKTVCLSRVVLSKSCVQFFVRTAGLTDYEVRDLNDEINKLMREKRHWENQIIALGGANYRRNVAMLDDDGREVPGTKGYKCAKTSPISFFFELRSEPFEDISVEPRSCRVSKSSLRVAKRKKMRRTRRIISTKSSQIRVQRTLAISTKLMESF